MTKLLQRAIAEIEKLPDTEQDAAAGALLDYLDHMRDARLTEQQVEEVKRRMAQPGATIPLADARERLSRRGT